MSIKNSLVVVLICLVLIIAGFFGYLIYQGKKIPKSIVSNPVLLEKNINKNYPQDLQGQIYMTLRSKETDKIGIYYFDLNKNKLETVHIVQDSCYISGGEVSRDDNMLIADSCDVENFESVQVFAADRNKQIKAITKNSKNFKKEPVWSEDQNKIAFMATTANSGKTKFEDWQIFVSDLEGNEKIVANNAIHPFFSPDDKKILALKKDGLFLFNIEDGTESKVYDFGAEVPLSFQFDLSIKKNLIAISNPLYREVIIYRINSWEDFEMKEITRISTPDSYVSWPKFDPSSKYLVTEEIDNNNLIKLNVYNLKTRDKYVLADLNAYHHDYLWINDWK